MDNNFALHSHKSMKEFTLVSNWMKEKIFALAFVPTIPSQIKII